MRNLTASEINKLKLLTEKSVEVALIEPTANGLNKSIMDATAPVRIYLKANGIHDYEHQHQGPNHKILIGAKIITKANVIGSTASLYRPVTKNGDPRIWFKNLGKYSKSNDILGIIAFQKILYVFNLTRLDIKALLNSKQKNFLKELILEINSISNEIAVELLVKLRQISLMGPIPALLDADTSVGRTLETLLGIRINSSRKPDYKGIELKSFRDERSNRKSLFAQVPNWSLSKFKSSTEILKEFGYYDINGEFRLYCTVTTKNRNPQSLKLNMDIKGGCLYENSDKNNIGDFVVWVLEKLHKRLLEKHNETFWIKTTSKLINGREHFIYKEAEHTRKPIVAQFDLLLEQGIITLDHLIKWNGRRGNDKGPFFKINSKSLNLLFPPSQTYSLIS